jgi:microcystin-dependent protein
MSFRQFGGLQHASKHNAVASYYNTSNNLLVTQNVGQSNSYINFLSDISGNISIYGDLDVSGNLHVSGDVDISGNLHVSGTIINTAMQPGSSDSSTKVPTTAWVQTAISVSAALTGSIHHYAGNTVPSGYLLCDGALVSRTTYSNLFSAIGTIYGVGDGLTTFGLPNLVSKYIQGSSTSANVSTGSNTTPLVTANLPATTCTIANNTATTSNIPIAFNSVGGIGDWHYDHITPSGSQQSQYFTNVQNSTHSGSNLINAFTASFGFPTPTAINTTPSSISMMVLIKT